MNKPELFVFFAVIILAAIAGIAGFDIGIPANELYLHPEFDIPVVIAFFILFILGKIIRDKDDNDK